MNYNLLLDWSMVLLITCEDVCNKGGLAWQEAYGYVKSLRMPKLTLFLQSHWVFFLRFGLASWLCRKLVEESKLSGDAKVGDC